MRITGLITTGEVNELRMLPLRAGDTLVVARTSESLLTSVRDRDCAVVIVDPLSLREDAFDQLMSALAVSGVGLIMLASLNRPAVSRILRAAQRLPVEIVFRGFDSAHDCSRPILRTAPVASVQAMVLHNISVAFARLPESIAVVCTALFGGLPVPPSVNAFATKTLWHRRTLERALARAGLRSAKALLDVARLARVWSKLHGQAQSIGEIATSCGFASPKMLDRHFNVYIGISPSRAIRDMSAERFAAVLVDACQRPPAVD